MAQLDDLQSFVNYELPFRSALKKYSDVAYDGDPNNVAAPNDLKFAPTGTWYFRSTPSPLYYRKIGGGATDWLAAPLGDVSIVDHITAEDLTATVDYNLGTAVDPSPGTTFTTQVEIDDFLAANGTTAFKHLMAFYDALPILLAHRVTINLAAGVHRPQTTITTVAWNMITRQSVGGGGITIAGPLAAAYTLVVAAQTITAHQVGSFNPYLDFAGTPFLGIDVRGYYAVLSNGQQLLIHDQTDSRLYVTNGLSPTPVNGVTTCEVKRPSAVLRNSLNDTATKATASGLVVNVNNIATTNPRPFVIQDVSIEPYGLSSQGVSLLTTTALLTRVLIDHETPRVTFGVTGNGNVFVVTRCPAVSLTDCCFRSERNGAGPDGSCGVGSGSIVGLSRCYIQGGDETCASVAGSGATLNLNNSVFASGGGDSPSLVRIADDGVLGGQDFTTAVRSTFRDSPGGRSAIFVANRGRLNLGNSGLPWNPQFQNITGPCIRISGDVQFDMTVETPTNGGWINGGGNTDVGVQIDGPGARIKFSTPTNVTGTLGDVRMGGTIFSYATILASGPIADDNFNSVDKV